MSLFKRKICYFRVFVMYKRGKPFEKIFNLHNTHFMSQARSSTPSSRVLREMPLLFRLSHEAPVMQTSKFPECKQMINEAWVFSNCLFVFFRFLYLPMEIISSRSRTVRGWIPRKTRYFYVFYRSTMSTMFADSRMEVRRYRLMDINGLISCPKSFLLT